MKLSTPLQIGWALFLGTLGVCALAGAEPTAPVPGAPSHAPAPTADKTIKQTKEGEMDVTIKGQSREKMTVEKLDPPAAFNLEDIQNFPEDRLQPVLNNPLTFEEGHDFSTLLDFKEDQLAHPWLTELSMAPYLRTKTPATDKTREWTFSIIDQGAVTVWKQAGKGTPPSDLSWNGQDEKRDHVAVDTVYIPQLSTIDKDGYHHTFMGQPVQFASLLYKDPGKTLIELSSKKLFIENKSELTKEAPLLLEKVLDVLREDAHLPFAVQPYDADPALARSRQDALVKYFIEKLVIPDNQVLSPAPLGPEKRGAAVAIIVSAVPGGAQ